MLTIERKEQGLVTILRLKGEIDPPETEILRREILNCIQGKRYRLVLNLAAVRLLGYMGVPVLMEDLSRLRACNGDIKLACPNLQSRQMLGMLGLGQVFEMYEIESAAVQGYKQVAA